MDSIEELIVDAATTPVSDHYETMKEYFGKENIGRMSPFLPVVVAGRRLTKEAMQDMGIPALNAVFDMVEVDPKSADAEKVADLAAIVLGDVTTMLMQHVQQQQEQQARASQALATGNGALLK